MADETATTTPQPEQPAGPMLQSLVQYTKDLSFENPNAPRSLAPREGAAPEITITVNVNATHLGEDQFQVELHLEGRAKHGEDIVFAFDLSYGGIYRLQNIPQEQVQPVVMIECPRLLFPFARQIVAEAVRNGGFPPLYIDPIDFVGLYNQNMQNAQAQTQTQAA